MSDENQTTTNRKVYHDTYYSQNRDRILYELELAYASAMDDSDTEIVKEAMKIYKKRTLTIEEKTRAIWGLFEERHTKSLRQ